MYKSSRAEEFFMITAHSWIKKFTAAVSRTKERMKKKARAHYAQTRISTTHVKRTKRMKSGKNLRLCIKAYYMHRRLVNISRLLKTRRF